MNKILPITLIALLTGCAESYTAKITTESSTEVYETVKADPIEQEETKFKETDMADTEEVEAKEPTEPEETKAPMNYEGYTLQIIALTRQQDLSSHTEMLGEEQPVWMNKKIVKNMPWYTVLYGNFATPAEARAAIKQLPAKIQAFKPFVRSMASIKSSDNPELTKLN